MATFVVTVEGRATERYFVNAETADEAEAGWADGDLLSSEVWDCGPTSVRLADD